MRQTSGGGTARLEACISKKIHSFDIISLLNLLEHLGYGQEEIQFRSHSSTSSQPGLIHGISFKSGPLRQVTIMLNFGLLSAQTPLPSYFQKKLDEGMIDTLSFRDFIGYFDHHIIRSYLLSIYPEVNKSVYADWEVTKRRHLQMMNLRSRSTLHWLFQRVFPELGVSVEKAVLARRLTTSPLVLGKAVLGSDAVFGNKSSIPVQGRRIMLFSENELTCYGEPWPREIQGRLEANVFPLLRSVGIDLEILLVIRSQESWAKLASESFLGYDRIRGGEAQRRRIRIFLGRLIEQDSLTADRSNK